MKKAKKIIAITCFLFVTILLNAQDTLTNYFTEAWKQTTKDSAFFTQKKIKLGNAWAASTYYKSGVLQMKGVFSDDSLATPNGTIEWYRENGKISQTINYTEGKANGLNIMYYDNGKKRAEGYYKMGKLDGDWVGYYESGSIAAKAHYMEDEQKAGSFYNEDGTTNKSIKLFYRPAAFPGGNDALARYLKKTLQYPQAAQKKEIEGTVIIQFMIKTDGTLAKIGIAKSVEPSLDREALRVIREMPEWIPGLNGGRYAEYYMKQPVTFKLKP